MKRQRMVHPLVQPAGTVSTRKIVERSTAVILGAAGDLMKRKLLPAIYSLAHDKVLPDDFNLVAVGRDPLEDAAYTASMREALDTADDISSVDEATWSWLASRITYTSGDLTDPAVYQSIGRCLDEVEKDLPDSEHNRIFYLAIPPSVFDATIQNLSTSGLAALSSSADERPWSRVVIEKPFGRDLESARALNAVVLDKLAEHQVYRIDHYLGKETVQNVLVFRFANPLFEPLWSRQYIRQVQITVAESVGIEQRGKYYEEAGVIRDMFQNHLLQLLALAAMEPPVAFTADDVRDEKVKVLRSLTPLMGNGEPPVVIAQYAGADIDGNVVAGYREEANVAADSSTPTYAAIRFEIDNWRWKHVPFFLRSGKRLPNRTSEIAIEFRPPPVLMFDQGTLDKKFPSVLIIRVQPDEGISLRFNVKTPGTANQLTPEFEISPVEMEFCYDEVFGGQTPPAYQTLLLDVMLGDATLFTRSDEVEAAWTVIDPVLRHFAAQGKEPLPQYAPGSWGPVEADKLLDPYCTEWIG
ncbi:MAG: glucose-6-phosphate dehydrogenase [Gemmatimonadaceae bacterium]